MNYFKNKTILVILGVLLAGAISWGSYTIFKNGNFDTYVIERADFDRTVTVSGKVVPAQEIDLAFEFSGKVDQVFVNIGDQVRAGEILARLDNSEILNEIQEADATLKSKLAELNEVTNTSDLESQIESIKSELLNVLKKSYVSSDDIIRNQVDTFIEDPESRFPSFSVSLRDYFTRQEINQKRNEIQDVLEEWKIFNDDLIIEDISINDANYNIKNLQEIEKLLNIISAGTVEFTPTSNITQSQIDAYITGISNSRTTVAGLIIDINKATEAVRASKSNIPVLEANIENSRATVNKLENRVDKYVLRAPFDGVVTSKDIEKGEISQIGKNAISIIGEATLEIETFIPEIRIEGVDLGDEAHVTMDAFGESKIFDLIVAHIDPRETEKDGITTYRTLLNFTENTEDVRPGMTAEITIKKEQIKDVILVPAHLIRKDESGDYVEIVEQEKPVKKSIEVGKSDGKGSVIVESGLKVGDKILIPIKN